MYIPFENMPDNARIWIYQADRTLTNRELARVEEKLIAFLDQWAAHNQPLQASSKIFYNRFMVIALNEAYNAASGCSIDDSVHFLRGLEKDYYIGWLDRNEIAFLDDKQQIFTEKIEKLKQKIAKGIITAQTQVFNNLVPTLGDLDKNWIQTAQESWMARYF